MKIEYVGKCLLLTNKKERTLAIGDLHLGYEGSMRSSGVMIPVKLYNKCISDFDEIINKTGDVDNIVILGDLKHEFGKILSEEWQNIINFIKYVQKKCKKLIIIEGNHDVILFPILKKIGVIGADYYIWNNFAFCHGDMKIDKIYSRKIDYWVIGHGHPAITLYDKSKKEKYKCFLKGKYSEKGTRNVIIVPSFFPLIEGTDPRDYGLNFAWKFDLNKFEIIVVGDNLETFKFGKLKNINYF